MHEHPEEELRWAEEDSGGALLVLALILLSWAAPFWV
jgi:hypothetical protein